jgi:DNA-binding transcriptional MocR family regulator
MVAYKRLAQQVEMQFTDETRLPGDKMPSLRHFAQQQSVSMTTAIRCYEYLQDRGYLTSRAKSGFYVSLPLKADKTIEFIQFDSEVTALTQPLSSSYSSLKNVRNSPFGTAQLSPALLPAEPLQRCINRVMRKQNNSQFLYGDPQGSQTLRETLAIHFSKQGLTIQPQQRSDFKPGWRYGVMDTYSRIRRSAIGKTL